jgi:hypothetical protein
VPPVSDLLEAASNALGTPAELVRRSAAARAEANGTTIDDILAAWGGGAPAPAPAASADTEPEPATEPDTAPEPEAQAEPAPATVAVVDESAPELETAVEAEPEPVEALDPIPLSVRMTTAVRIGAWTGAALGVVGFLVASAFWAPNTTILPDSGPVVQVSPNGVLIGSALISIVFGAIVAGMSRAAAGWSNPAMQLANSKSSTAWLGAAVGIVLGVIAGAMLNGFGTEVEGAEPALVQLPVLATLFVMVIGGAILGAVTAFIPQVLGVPVAVDESDTEEVDAVKGRLGNALAIPLIGVLILVLLVLPFAYALIQSNHLAPRVGGAVVAVIAAGGILGFSALAGSRPQMRISLSDLMVAVIGMGVIITIIISVLVALTR